MVPVTPASIITDLLRRIPSWLRLTLLALFALAVVVESILRIFEVALPYDKINQVLVLIGGYLGVQSAANVKVEHREEDPTLW